MFAVYFRLGPRRTREGGGGEGRRYREGRFKFVVGRVLVGVGVGGGGVGGVGGGDDNLRH